MEIVVAQMTSTYRTFGPRKFICEEFYENISSSIHLTRQSIVITWN